MELIVQLSSPGSNEQTMERGGAMEQNCAVWMTVIFLIDRVGQRGVPFLKINFYCRLPSVPHWVEEPLASGATKDLVQRGKRRREDRDWVNTVFAEIKLNASMVELVFKSIESPVDDL